MGPLLVYSLEQSPSNFLLLPLLLLPLLFLLLFLLLLLLFLLSSPPLAEVRIGDELAPGTCVFQESHSLEPG